MFFNRKLKLPTKAAAEAAKRNLMDNEIRDIYHLINQSVKLYYNITVYAAQYSKDAVGVIVEDLRALGWDAEATHEYLTAI